MGNDTLWELDSEISVKPDGDCVGVRSVSQDNGHLHMDNRLPDKRRGGPRDDGRLVTGQGGFMERSQKAPPNEYGYLPV